MLTVTGSSATACSCSSADGAPSKRRELRPLALSASYDATGDTLGLGSPGGGAIVGSAAGNGGHLALKVGGREQRQHRPGPWEARCRARRATPSDRSGQRDRDGMVEPVTVYVVGISRAARARGAGLETIDAGVPVALQARGCAEHGEDGGRKPRRIGEALVEIGEPDPAVTTRDRTRAARP